MSTKKHNSVADREALSRAFDKMGHSSPLQCAVELLQLAYEAGLQEGWRKAMTVIRGLGIDLDDDFPREPT